MTKPKVEKQVVVPPHNLKGCPCQPLVEAAVEKALDEGDDNIIGLEVSVEVCKKLKCKFLLKNKVGAYRCSRFMQELRGRKRGVMRATKTLRMRGGDKDGWRYRDLP